jgi:glycosyltransferase involved in cell wall biosynthesis
MNPLEIVILYDGGPVYTWDGSAIEDGIGGSEECLIMLAEALQKAGNFVRVYNNCACVAYVNRVKYVPFKLAYNPDKPLCCDIVMSWRNWRLHEQVPSIPDALRLHCSHDIPVGCHAPAQSEMDDFNRYGIKCVFLNPYHRSLHPWIPDESVAVIPIGIPPWNPFAHNFERDLSRVLYFSHPHRGLHVLRSIWPEVRRAVPEATLASFWWQEEFFLPPDEAIGILPMKVLSSNDAAVECRKAGIFGYPCTFEHEISPATCIKAQAGGAYPVVVMQGGMRDVVQFGLVQTQENFKDALIVALQRSIEGRFDGAFRENGNWTTTRRQMMSWATKTYGWDAVAGQYVELFWSKNP